MELAAAPRTKSTDKARTRPACGKGSSELGIGELRQAGPAEWAVATADGTTGQRERFKQGTGLKEARLARRQEASPGNAQVPSSKPKKEGRCMKSCEVASES